MWYRYTMEYYSAIKKNEIMPFAATCLDLEIVIDTENKQVVARGAGGEERNRQGRLRGINFQLQNK